MFEQSIETNTINKIVNAVDSFNLFPVQRKYSNASVAML